MLEVGFIFTGAPQSFLNPLRTPISLLVALVQLEEKVPSHYRDNKGSLGQGSVKFLLQELTPLLQQLDTLLVDIDWLDIGKQTQQYTRQCPSGMLRMHAL
jgi:hypothetical protein